MIYDRKKVVEKAKPGIIYQMCLEVKDNTTGKILIVDFPEFLMNTKRYEVLNPDVLVPA